MRAMEFSSRDGREVELNALLDAIGQEVYNSPTVFNFYLPEFQSGPVIDANLRPRGAAGHGAIPHGLPQWVSSLVRFDLDDVCERIARRPLRAGWRPVLVADWSSMPRWHQR